MNKYLRLINIKHWIKNIFVFAPLFFSARFFEGDLVGKSLTAAAAFSLASSSVYIINGIKDRHADKIHPGKKNRPVASGLISVRKAVIILIFMLIITLLSSLLCMPSAILIIFSYLLINVFYSFGLKNIPIIEVFILASGYLLRLIVGAVVIGLTVSSWMIMTTFFLAMFLGFSKRRCEYIILDKVRERHRPVFAFYNLESLNVFVNISAGLTIICYALYTINSNTFERLGQEMIYTVPFVVLGIFRYIQKIYLNEIYGDPVELVLKDKLILCIILFWGLLIFALIVYNR